MKEKKFKCWQIYWKRKSSIHKMASNSLATLLLNESRLPDTCVRTQHTHSIRMIRCGIHLFISLPLLLWLCPFFPLRLTLIRKFIYSFGLPNLHTATHAVCLCSFRLIYSVNSFKKPAECVWANRECHSIQSDRVAIVFYFLVMMMMMMMKLLPLLSSNVVCLLLFICSEGNVDFSMIWKIYSDELWAIACVRTLVLSLICIHFGLYRASSLLYYYYDCCLVLLIHRFQ